MQMINTLLPYIQLILAVLLVSLILLQQNEGSLGSAFGGSDTGGSIHKKRGLEKIIFDSTIVVSCLFILSAILALFI